MFSKWLKQKLQEKQWSQSDLSRFTEKAGYPISHNQISRILSGRQQAGPDACIAIAHGLGVPREKVFRARGWLLHEPIMTTKVMPSEVAQVFTLLDGLPEGAQIDVATALREMVLSARRMIAGAWEIEDEPDEPLNAEDERLEQLVRRVKGMKENLAGKSFEKAIGMLEDQVELLELAAQKSKA